MNNAFIIGLLLVAVGSALIGKFIQLRKRNRDAWFWSSGMCWTYWPGFLLLIVGLLMSVGSVIGDVQTHEGDNVGYVVDVDYGGIIWQTTGVEIRTSGENPDSYYYCATDPDVIRDLYEYATQGVRVHIEYTTHLFWSEGCTWENDKTIRSVTPIYE